MIVTYPHMGYMWIGIKAMLEYLGVKVVIPPPSSKRTLALGAKHGPEFACLPLKLNLGNFMEAAEQGADTMMMAGGCGPCRFGYYAQVEHAILQDLNYNYKLVVLEPPEKRISELLVKIRYLTGNRPWLQVIKAIRFGFRKVLAVDELERISFKMRPREVVAGATDRAFNEALAEITPVREPAALPGAVLRAMEIMAGVAVDQSRPVLRVGLVGEIYTLLEPFVNQDMERHLGRMGVEVDRSIFLGEWINDHLFKGLYRGMRSAKDFRRSAGPYLNHFVGGHGQESVGATIMYARQGYDGVIQLLPFTCMPEIVAQSILPVVSKDTGLPTLSMIFDEQSGEAGMLTRLEAFVDLLAGNRRMKEAAAR